MGHERLGPAALFCRWRHERLLRRILHLAVSKRPILTCVVNQSDPDILLAKADLGVEIDGDPPVQGLLYLCGPHSNPEYLNENDLSSVIDAEILVLRMDALDVSVDAEE